MTINPGENVELRWASDGTRCTGDAHFSTGPSSPASGTQQTVTEPANGDRTYTVRCYDGSGPSAPSTTDTATVTISGGDPTISANPLVVDCGSTSTVTWNANGHPGCAVSGTNGDTVGTPPLTTGSGATDALYGETVYTIRCSDSTPASVTIRVRPMFEEI